MNCPQCSKPATKGVRYLPYKGYKASVMHCIHCDLYTQLDRNGDPYGELASEELQCARADAIALFKTACRINNECNYVWLKKKTGVWGSISRMSLEDCHKVLAVCSAEIHENLRREEDYAQVRRDFRLINGGATRSSNEAQASTVGGDG